MKKPGPNQKIKDKYDFLKKGWGKTLKQWWRNYQWWVMLLGVIAVFILGYIGYLKAGKTLFTDILYRIFQLFVLSFDTSIMLNGALEAARWLAPSIAAYAGIKALIAIFSEQFQLLKIRFLKKHIIICGLGRKGLLLCQMFKNHGFQVVVIEQNEKNDKIKQSGDNGSIVLVGNATLPSILSKSGLNKAKHLFAVCGSDGTNAEIAILAREFITTTAKRKKPLSCTVHIEDPQLCRLLKEREFETEKNDMFRLEFFNLFDQAAKSLLYTYPPFEKKKESRPSSPHLLIIGAGKLGESLVTLAAKKWMKLSLTRKTRGKLRISIIDKAAKQKRDLFCLRYPHLDKICRIVPLEMDIESKDFEKAHFLFTASNNRTCDLDSIYICLDNDSFALSVALSLHQRLRDHDIPIVVRMIRESGLAALFTGKVHGFHRLNAFGFLDRVLKPELLLMGTNEILAQSIHQEYLRNQSVLGDTPETNPSLVSWEKLPESLKESNRRQTDFMGVKLKQIDYYIIPMTDLNAEPIEFTPGEIELMAKMEHDHWMEERLKNGWKYAPGPKDNQKKTHPSLVSWEKLSDEEKEKDRNTVREISASLETAGFQIYRREKYE
jgi:hypothetical protein